MEVDSLSRQESVFDPRRVPPLHPVPGPVAIV